MTSSLVRIICSGGVSIIPIANGRFQFEFLSNEVEQAGQSLAEITSRFAIYPLLAIFPVDGVIPQQELLLSNHGEPIVCKFSELRQKLREFQEFSWDVHNLFYSLRSVAYHVGRLAAIEFDIVRIYHSLPHSEPKSPTGCFQVAGEQYFELDAAIVAARRTYEYAKNWIWTSFEAKQGTRPSSYAKFLENPAAQQLSFLPRLVQSWNQYGSKLKEYRDCLLHNASIDFGMTTAIMRRLPNGAWSTATLIPCNPDAKSKSAFSYDNRVDGMTFLWQVANELLSLAETIVESTEIKTEVV